MAGATPKYKKKFCTELIEAGQNMIPFRRFCTNIGIASSTGYEWVKIYPDFGSAKETYDDLILATLEEKAFDAALEDAPTNTAILKMMMARRSKEYRKDVLEGTTALDTLKTGGTVTINFAEATEDNIPNDE